MGRLQVTIICAERGLLLLRVRDEIRWALARSDGCEPCFRRMTICAYQSLYESSIAFGMRKAFWPGSGKKSFGCAAQALQAEQRRNQHNKKMKDCGVGISCGLRYCL